MKKILNFLREKRNNEEGFTLAEVLVAAGLFAMIGTASAYFLVNSTRTISYNESKDNATQYVRDYIETVKAVEYNKLGFDPSISSVPASVERNGLYYDTVQETGLTATVNGLVPRATKTINTFEYTIYTYIYWTDGTAPISPTAYEQKTVEVEVWLDGNKISSAQFVRTPTAAERPVAGGSVNVDAVAEGQRKPEEPLIITTLQGDDDDKVRLEFSATYAKDYTLEYSLNGAAWLTYTDNSFSDSAVNPKVFITPSYADGDELIFRVTGINSNGSGTPGSINVTIPSSKPAAPNVFFNQSNDNSVRIYWNAVQYANSYSVKYTINGGPSKTEILTGTELTVDPKLAGDILAVTVTGYNGKVAGYPSNTSFTLANRTPMAPTLNPLTQSNTNIIVTWASVANATQYQVSYTVNGGSVITETVEDNSAILTNFENNDVVRVQVKAANSLNSWGPNSAAASFTIILAIPSTPVLSGSMNTTDKIYTVTWPATLDTESYVIYTSKNNSADITTWEAETTLNRSLIYSVEIGTPLYFKVMAVSAAGYKSVLSNTVTGFIPDQKPAKITTSAYASANGIPNYNFTDIRDVDNMHTYSWDTVPYATYYEVQTVNVLGQAIGAGEITELTVPGFITTEYPGSHFKIRVRGISVTGISGDWGTVFEFTRGLEVSTISTASQIGNIYATWTLSEGASQYEVQYKTNNTLFNGGTSVKDGSVISWISADGVTTSVTFDDYVNEGDLFTARIRVISPYGAGEWSPWTTPIYAGTRTIAVGATTGAPHTSGGYYSWPVLACDTGNVAEYQTYNNQNSTWSGFSTNRSFIQSFGYGYGGTIHMEQRCRNTSSNIITNVPRATASVGYRLLPSITWDGNMWRRMQQATGYSITGGSYGRATYTIKNAAYAGESVYLQSWMNAYDNGQYSNIATDGYWGPGTTLKLQQNIAIRCGYWVGGTSAPNYETISGIYVCMNNNTF